MNCSTLLRTLSFALLSIASVSAGCSSSDDSSSAGAAGTAGAAGSSATANCDAARACCAGLSGHDETVCVKAANDAQYGSSPDVDCATVVAKYKPDGVCATGTSGAGGTGGAGGAGASGTSGAAGSGPQQQSAVCARYVACQTAVNPATASTYETTYGAEGTCWASASSAMECDTQCKSGLSTFHASFPEDCVVCVADSDCSGATSKCDTTQGDCVAP